MAACSLAGSDAASQNDHLSKAQIDIQKTQQETSTISYRDEGRTKTKLMPCSNSLRF